MEKMNYLAVFILVLLYCSASVVCQESGETTTDQAFIITTIEPSSRESLDRDEFNNDGITQHDFAVPDPAAPLPPLKAFPDADKVNKVPAVVSAPTVVVLQGQPPSAPAPTSSSAEPPLSTSSSTENGNQASSTNVPEEDYKPLSPEIYSFHIESNIRYRYSRTFITSRVVNRDMKRSSEVRFRVVLPETAFISKFLMEIDGKTYEAYVKEKEEAKNIYNQAQSQGQSAGLVELNTRNTNVFDVNVNIKAQSKVNFNLTYEELLSRRLGKYEQSINISPEQITNVKDFQILVTIEESQNITQLKVPDLRNDVETQQDQEGNNKDAVIERPAGNKAKITWKPSEQVQSQLDKQKLTGKFIVQYDIARELDAGEVLVMNGYFVHFFAPENLKPLRKHVVFVLDTSGSMWGRRIEQLKEAMTKILADLTPDFDYFNILTFASDVVLWSPDDKTPLSPNSHWSPPGQAITKLIDTAKKQPYLATKENIQKAQLFINGLVASGGTNIHDSVVQALNLTNAIKLARDGPTAVNTTSKTNPTTVVPDLAVTSPEPAPEPTTTQTVPTTQVISKPLTILPANAESLIIFLTDGEPTVGITNPITLQSLIKTANANSSIPIFSLGFGDGADFPFLRKLSLQNNGFARKIYEASDAALQLKGFYNEIASPLLSNVTFNYTSPDYSIENVTITKYPTVFGGTEITVAGKIVPKEKSDGKSSLEATESEVIVDANDDAVTTSSTPKPRIVIVGETPAISSRLNDDNNDLDSFNEVSLVPTDKHYFDVYIEGYGRDGSLRFNNPEIFSSPIPWGIPVVRPFPPRPTVAPTQEDVFLERLWAYLTIRQLIDKDLAQEEKTNEVKVAPTPTLTPSSVASTTFAPGYGNNTTPRNVTVVVPETPKQRALRLALKYKFVTPLTSLVVVKPNSSDVTDSVPTDPQAGISAPVSLKYGHASLTNRVSSGNFVPLSLHHSSGFSSANRIVGFGGAPGIAAHPGIVGFGRPGPPPLPLFPIYTTTASFVQRPTTAPGNYQPPTTYTTPTVTPTVTPGIPSVVSGEDTDEEIMEEYLTTVSGESAELNSSLTLNDISWYNGSAIFVNTTEYNISTQVADKFQGQLCSVDLLEGVCVHLKDCVQTVFKDNFDVYSQSYFCPIQNGQSFYAGACCTQEVPAASTLLPSFETASRKSTYRKNSQEDLSYS